MSFERQSIAEFCAALASSDPTPGGGTASAAAGAVGASLVSMVIALTLSKEKYRDAEPDLAPIAAEADAAGKRLRALMQEDAEAYDGMVAARKLPKDTDEEKQTRKQAMAAAARRATEIPMETARVASRICPGCRSSRRKATRMRPPTRASRRCSFRLRPKARS